jgi:hypothetical protein
MDDNRPSEPINNYVSGNINLSKSCQHNNYICDFTVKPIESKIYVPPSERPTSSEPQKYTGSSIPSRSFRMLQAMTGQNNGNIFVYLLTKLVLMKSGDQIYDTIVQSNLILCNILIHVN